MVSNKRRIVKNSIFLLSRTIFLTLVTLYTLREVISILGTEQFGLYTVVFGIVAMFGFVNGALLSGTQRFLSIDIGKNDINLIKNTFISGFYIHLIVSFFLCFLIYLFRDYIIENILNIKNFKSEAVIIYNFATLSIFISILQIPFSALITAYEKMQAFAYLAILDGILKLLVVYFLNFFDINKVVLYSFFLTLVSFFIFIFNILYCYISFGRVVAFNFVALNKIKLLIKDMLQFMGWNLIGNLSVVMRNQGANVILNIFFGLMINTAFAISLTVMAAISTLLSSVSNAINPQIYKNYANKNFKNYYNLIDYGTKFCMIVVSVVIFPLIFSMEYILKLWLKSTPSYAVELTQLGLVLVLIESFSILIVSAIQATGNIKGTQIIVGTLLLLNIPISYLLFMLGFSPKFILIVPICIAFIAFFVRILFLIKLTNYRFKMYVLKVFMPILTLQVFILLGILIYNYIFGTPQELSEFIYFLISFGLYSLFLSYFIGLNEVEKQKIRSIVFKKDGKFR